MATGLHGDRLPTALEPIHVSSVTAFQGARLLEDRISSLCAKAPSPSAVVGAGAPNMALKYECFPDIVSIWDQITIDDNTAHK